jgi:hypothetical protein
MLSSEGNSMGWREFIQNLDSECTFQPPAAMSQINDVEKALQITFPSDLSTLLLETNSVYFPEYYIHIVWSIELILKVNTDMRTKVETYPYNMPFDHLLFFADAGNGDQFAFPIGNDNKVREKVFVWKHEDDSRAYIARNFSHYLEKWLTRQMLSDM